jgi:hypothetical protein
MDWTTVIEVILRWDSAQSSTETHTNLISLPDRDDVL